MAQNNSTNHGDEVPPEKKDNKTAPASSGKVAVKATSSEKAMSKCSNKNLSASDKEDCELEEKLHAAKTKKSTA